MDNQFKPENLKVHYDIIIVQETPYSYQVLKDIQSHYGKESKLMQTFQIGGRIIPQIYRPDGVELLNLSRSTSQVEQTIRDYLQ